MITWAGLVFWTDSVGHLPQVDETGAWGWVFLGAGLCALCPAYFRLGSQNYPNPEAADYVWAGFWTLLGLDAFPGFDVAWPLILVAVGVAFLGKALRQGPPPMGCARAETTRGQAQ